MPRLKLRPATEADLDLVFGWSSDPAVRQASFQQAPIPYPEHVAWFKARLADPKCLFLIICEGEEPVGQVRLDLIDDRARVSISLAGQARGRGLGRRALEAAAARAADLAPGVRELIAQVKPDNQASLEAFRRAGFEEVAASGQPGFVSFRLVLD